MRGKAGPKPAKRQPKQTSRGKIQDAAEAQKAAAAAVEQKAAAATMTMPTTNDVQNLARRCRSLKKQGSEITGQIGEMVAQAAEKKSLDRKAFAIVRGLDSMSDDKLRVTYHHMLRYMDDLGISKRATAQAEMFEEKPEGEGEEPLPENVARGDFRRRMQESQGQNYMRSGAPVSSEQTEGRAVEEAAGT